MSETDLLRAQNGVLKEIIAVMEETKLNNDLTIENQEDMILNLKEQVELLKQIASGKKGCFTPKLEKDYTEEELIKIYGVR